MLTRFFSLPDFVRESNRIEGIFKDDIEVDLAAHIALLELPELMVHHVCAFVHFVADAELRRAPGMNVRVGRHRPPPGGPLILHELQQILDFVNFRAPDDAWAAHHRYETLHPFLDGNGRSGRAIWLWQMGGISKVPLGFLHTFYHQTLQASRP